ncbi:MAG: helix-turn-helix transcriptional regulator [Cyanobacteria bacterium P01_A01_bin.83]
MPVLVKLKNTREALGLSQNELARRTGYSLQNIQKIEQGRAASITFDALERFCKVLECQPGDLLEWQPDNIDDKKQEFSNHQKVGDTLRESQKSHPSKHIKGQITIITIDESKDVA